MLEEKQYTEQELLDEIDRMDMETYLKEHSGVKHIDSKKLMEHAIAESQRPDARERLLERMAKHSCTYEEAMKKYDRPGLLHTKDCLGGPKHWNRVFVNTEEGVVSEDEEPGFDMFG